MVEVKNVSKSFNGIKAVDDISFTVGDGKNMILLGTSGCGKTTTLKIINRLINPDSGSINIAGQDALLKKPELLRRRIGYVLQEHGLFPHYTVAQNIGVVGQLLKWDAGKIKSRTTELIEKLRLPLHLLGQYPGQLSGGQQQRVGLARALFTDPPVLLMDEPFGALDPVTRAGIRKEFSSLDELKRKTIVMVTHDVQEAFELADRICLMDKGHIMQNGTPAELLFKPAAHFVSSFLAEQRLQLEFKAVTLNDVWPYLTDGPLPHAPANELPTSQQVWQTLENLTLANPAVIIAKNQQGQQKPVTFAGLTQAFYQYQHTRTA